MVATGLMDNTLSISDIDNFDNSAWIYPVPAKQGILNIHIPADFTSHEYGINIIDSFGRMITSKTYYNRTIELNVSDLYPGLYFIRIMTDKGDQTKRIVIE
jgi:hypothetical protein